MKSGPISLHAHSHACVAGISEDCFELFSPLAEQRLNKPAVIAIQCRHYLKAGY